VFFSSMTEKSKFLRFGVAIVVIVVSLGYLAWTGVRDTHEYYVTIKELQGMNDTRYAKRLRVAGNVLPGSIKRHGTEVTFSLKENEMVLPVVYKGSEALPDTFKDDAQALAFGRFGRDGVFRANQVQAKCASKYAPAPGQTQPASVPMQTSQAGGAPASSGTSR
jgi:cytochrome c-type biogenesis protein CcmE